MVDVPDKEDHDGLQEQVWQLEKRIVSLVRKTNWLQQELNYCRLGSGLTELNSYEEVEDDVQSDNSTDR